MALTKESQKYFDDKIASLSAIGNLISSNEKVKQSEISSINWDIKKFDPNTSIGGFSCGENVNGEEILLYTNPYSAGYTKIKVRYKAETRSKQKYLIFSDYGETTVEQSSSGLASGNFYIEIDKKQYKWNSVTEINFDGIKNGMYIKHNNSKGTAFYAKYHTEINKGATDANNLAIPFYSWYKSGNNLWIGTSIGLSGIDGKTKIVSGWIRVFADTTDVGSMRYTLYIKENEYQEISKIDDSNTMSQTGINEENNLDPNGNPIGSGENNTPDELEGRTDWENSENGYEEALYASDSQAQIDYWKKLYGETTAYSLKSHKSIIGLPLQFMPNVDMRVGSSTYGKQFMEDILYDMSIACIKPGGPVLNPNLDESAEYSDGFISNALGKIGKIKAYLDSISTYGAGETLKQYLFSLFKGGSARFYSFQSDYTHYSHYVNTLCHLFITYLNIGDKYYTTGSGVRKKYTFYNDDPSEIETDGGMGLHNQFGWDNAVYMYYSPESQLSHSFSNSTMSSGLNSTLQEASNAVKEWGFFINAAGIETGKSVVSSYAQSLAANSGGFIGRLFGKAAEGVTTVLAGNNLSLPEIYSDSETTVQHTFKIKLASPYGDPESVFLYVLRPLARLLAFSLPRQYGPNSYMSPFIIQAFSKGQFNCQLGIVTNLSITRCGNGGESHTINHIPTELEVTLEIQDMYEKVFLSNEYFGNPAWKAWIGAGIDYITSGFSLDKIGEGVGTTMMQMGTTLTAARLLFNNVGLIDFVASFCGANLNQPTYMSGWTVILNMMRNRSKEHIQYNEQDGWKFPQWEKQLNDAYHDAVTRLQSNITTIA